MDDERWIDRLIDESQIEHHGVFARREVEGLGVPKAGIDYRLRIGALETVHRGVLRRPGTPESFRGRVEAARLAVGDEAVAARRTAAALHGLLRAREIEIMTPRPRRARPTGFTVIRTNYLPDDHVVLVHGIPATSVPRTLLDLGGVLPPPTVKRLATDAVVRGLTSQAMLRAEFQAACRPGRPGSAVAREIAERVEAGELVTESELEDEMFQVIAKAGMPEPVKQYPVTDDGHVVARVDGAYPDLCLALEADGYEWHSAKAEWLRDRRRQNAIVALGWSLLRFTQEDSLRPRAFLSWLERTMRMRSQTAL